MIFDFINRFIQILLRLFDAQESSGHLQVHLAPHHVALLVMVCCLPHFDIRHDGRIAWKKLVKVSQLLFHILSDRRRKFDVRGFDVS